MWRGILYLLVLYYQTATSMLLGPQIIPIKKEWPFILNRAIPQQLLQGCSLITPSVLHMDNEETFVVTVHEYPPDKLNFDATITVRDSPLKRHILAEKKISIRKDNGFLGTVNITIPSTNLVKDLNKKQFVSVSVKFDRCDLEKVVLLSFRIGYIFVQTDKPIYTPGSQVLYRIFTMSLSLQPVNKPVVIEFLTPDNVTVHQEQLQSDKSGMISKSFALTEPASLGLWTITSKYKDSPAHIYKVHFEAKEYVLPSLEIKIKPKKKYLFFQDQEFKVQIHANYLYGKPVVGMAFVLFGVKKDSSDKSITDSLQRIEIHDGEGNAVLKRKDLVKMFLKERDMLQWKLYVSATVITDSGSDILETRLDDIHIVEFPYKILFIKTPKYFTPGMPLFFTVLVTSPDGSPVSGVPVVAQPGHKKGETMEDGKTRLSINTQIDETSLKITVLTEDGKIPSNHQATATMIATAYKSPGGNYLYLRVAAGQLKLQDNVHIEFTIKNSKGLLNSNVFYLILNKGRIIKAGRLVRQSQTVMSEMLSVTKDLLPSFHIVAYYVVDGLQEVVADSIWVDIEDTCAGTLQLTPYRESDTRIQVPGGNINLNLKADYQATVGLGAVDKGVYALNNKLKFSQSKIWGQIEKHDIGCTPGSGADALGVFYDSGLALQTNFAVETEQRKEPFCQGNRKVTRRKRDTEKLIQDKNIKASSYAGLQKICCMDGMRKNPMGHSCERRSHLIQEGKECIDAFLDCCRINEKIQVEKKPNIKSVQNFMSFSNNFNLHLNAFHFTDNEFIEEDNDFIEEDDDFIEDEEIIIRRTFLESWLWETKFMDEKPDENGISTKKLNISLKDSITTWEVLAVSLSKEKGICVSEPYDIVARMDFFIDLKFPYSIVRTEQAEIRAVLYNYGTSNIRVRVEWTYNEKFCSLSTAKKNYQRIVTVKADSSMVIPFIIVPLEVGSHEIEVKAAGQFVSDGVQKKLKVVPEGELVVQTIKCVVLDPEVKGRGGVQKEFIPAVDTKNVVANTEVKTLVTIQGTPISEMVQQSIDGISLNHLINLPSGCGEQNMMGLTSSVIATHFLDSTSQWERIGVNRRVQAIQYINTGISQQMAFRNIEAAYSAFTSRAASTWLTAYVVRVFTLASSITDIDKGQLCESVKWLIVKKQILDGVFREDAPIIHTYIMGGLEKSSTEKDSALTSFVLIALLDSVTICTGHINNLQASIDKVSSYISRQYQSLQKPHSIAIASYALAKAGKLQDINKLMSASTDSTHWKEEGYREITIESTSYALLTLLKKGEQKKAAPLAQWLTEQRFFGVFYGSTQATIMMFQALAQYHVDVPNKGVVNMDVTYKLPGKTNTITHKINAQNLMVARTDQTTTSGDFTVTAQGRGKGTLTVNVLYYAKSMEKQKKCNNFKLNVTVKKEEPAKNLGAISTISMEICTRFLQPRDAAMSVMEISMMTGFVPDITNLNELNKGVDRCFSKFEINKKAVDKEMLILYFDKIMHKEDMCLKFSLHQFFEVGYIQPASVTIYEYYAKENRCTKFYHVGEDSKLLGRICVGEVCRCSEENCFMQQQITKVDSSLRYMKTCDVAVEYVYKTTLSAIKEVDNYVTYVMIIKLVFREGIDTVTVNEKRDFISHGKCQKALNLQINRDYIVWGAAKDMWLLASKYSYMITKNTWIEMWPNGKECQEPQYINICSDLSRLTEEIHLHRCSA